eukprot:TRINITY_DN4479_c0_g1_i1.p1 TRINITY_DN4479_c0_g1~~TRINITY_DN4479_c0_g1_i1.p1  ORF type:complete len:971 (+),score=212.21 TRINITY_DN4479_c0_g1_i1:62-2914(+)
MRAASWVVLMCAAACCASALFADQAGLTDWHLTNVGEVVSLAYGSKVVYVGTTMGIVAAIDLTTGNTVWRQTLSKPVESVLLNGKLVVVAAGNYVASFTTTEGALRWDAALHCEQNDADLSVALVRLGNEDDTSDLAAKLGHCIIHVAGKNGETLGQISDPDMPVDHVSLRHMSPTVLVAGLDAEKHLSASVYDMTAHRAVLIRRQSADESSDFCQCCGAPALLFGKGAAFGCTTSGKTPSLCLGAYESGSWRTWREEVAVESLVGGPMAVAVKRADNCRRLAALRADVEPGWRHFIEADVSAEWCGEVAAPMAWTFVEGGDDGTVRVATVAKSVLEVHENGEKRTFPLVHAQKSGGVKRVFLSATASRTLPHLVVMRDLSLWAISPNNGSILWQRQEGLAGAEQIEFVDFPIPVADMAFPEPEDDITWRNALQEIPKQFIRRIIFEYQYLKQLLGGDGSAAQQARATGSAESKDRFGFRQLAVAYCSASRTAFALRAHDHGSLAWSAHIPLIEDSGMPLWQRLFVVRTSAHPPAIVAFAEVYEKSTVVTYLNAMTGDVVDTERFDHPICHVSMLPDVGPDNRNLLLLVERTGNESARAHFSPSGVEPAEALHVFLVGDHDITGMTWHPAAAEMALAWNTHLPATERIVETATRHQREVVKLPVKVLGDRNILAKYVNWNLVAVATLSEAQPSPKEHERSADTSSQMKHETLNVYLIDTLTGATILHTYSRRAGLPVRLVIADNALYYTYATPGSQWKLNVVELYEKTPNWNEVTLDTSLRVGEGLQAYTQGFAFPAAVMSLSPVVTAHGITSGDLLVAMDNSLYLLDHRLVGARRPPTPEEMTAADREEGLLPYQPRLPIVNGRVLSYGVPLVPGLSAVSVAPAHVESTCHAIAHGGADLFYVRVAPAGGYDLLGDEFDRTTVVATASLIFAATVLFWFLAKRRRAAGL